MSQSRGRLAPIQRSPLKKPLKEQVGLFTEYTRSLDARMETMLELERRNESESELHLKNRPALVLFRASR